MLRVSSNNSPNTKPPRCPFVKLFHLLPRRKRFESVFELVDNLAGALFPLIFSSPGKIVRHSNSLLIKCGMRSLSNPVLALMDYRTQNFLKIGRFKAGFAVKIFEEKGQGPNEKRGPCSFLVRMGFYMGIQERFWLSGSVRPRDSVEWAGYTA